MKIAIHHREGSYSNRWISYCKQYGISYKIVNCYASNIIDQLEDCDGLMWHFHHGGVKDFLFAKQLLFSLEASGKKVFPDFNTMWHFDDKVGQKYLLESIGAPLVPTWVFYSKKEAFSWANQTTFPKVFKLRNGAGSANVQLAKTKTEAQRFIRKAFGKGFPQYNAWNGLKERFRRVQLGKSSSIDLLKGLARFVIPTDFSKIAGREKGYVYFQEFVPGIDHDIRIIVIGDKAMTIKRMVRPNDFRASGSGLLKYDSNLFPKEVIKLAFDLTEQLKTQSLAADFIIADKNPLLIEISYGFPQKNFADECPGYWDKDLNWHEGQFNPYGWMVESLLRDKR